VNVELERSWPTFVVPSGLGLRQLPQDGASGGTVLLLSHASAGATAQIAFETALSGRYRLRVDAWAGPDEGDYTLELDGEPLGVIQGYSETRRGVRGAGTERNLAAGRHVLLARCLGHTEPSTGFDARLDALVGELAD
jgi:hypothetical protein